ncbi:hypothetical protein DBR06_SOUSAS5710058, partial [Sousa chinensis]
AMRKIEDNTTFVFIAVFKAEKHQIKQAVKKFHDTDIAKINALIWPDEAKKAFV